MRYVISSVMLSLMTIDAMAGDVFADTWAATDALGRSLPGHEEAGPVRADRTVGIFYWTWHTMQGQQGPYDISRIISENPEKPAFGPIGRPHHWAAPELGYSVSTDPYVIRRHANWLTDAGVDVILFDTTNPPFTFKESYTVLCQVYTQMLREGNAVPQIAFICPFGDPMPVLEQIYHDLYQPGHYRDLWFRWKGKPLVLADPVYVKDPVMKAFFTYRKPVPTYFDGPSGPNQWGWLEVFPQHVFYGETPDQQEQVTVGAAQNAVDGKLGPMSHKAGAYGRSRHAGQHDPCPDAVLHGYNFQEQWDRALKIDPPFVFVTGWNEWIAGRFTEWAGYTGQDTYYPEAVFVDEYNQEYSRDIEPMQGGHTDNYYYQLAANIRRYKGVRPLPPAGDPKTIVIDGQWEDWREVAAEYRDHLNDIVHRDHKGYGDLRYTDTTGRNDLAILKVARDAQNVCFYAETVNPLTSPADPNWMLLYIDRDQNPETGWQGYDYVVNLRVSEKTTSLHRLTDGWNPSYKMEIPYAVSGRKLELAIPRSALDYPSDFKIALDFKWADGVQKLGDLNDFFIHGDVAPERRFNYRYSE
jgi:hypothetical protein